MGNCICDSNLAVILLPFRFMEKVIPLQLQRSGRLREAERCDQQLSKKHPKGEVGKHGLSATYDHQLQGERAEISTRLLQRTTIICI